MSDPRTELSAAPPPAEPSSGGPAGVDAISDEMLLYGARQRDETALLMLYDRYGGLVYTLALRILGERTLAEEVTQDVFLRCWHGLEEYDATGGTLPVWLLGIARSRAIEALRGHQPDATPREREPLVEAGQRQPEVSERTDDVALRGMVQEALAELSEPQRAAIESAYYGGLTQTDVAARLGEPPGAVKNGIRDGVRRLRRLLAPIVDDSAQPGDGAS